VRGPRIGGPPSRGSPDDISGTKDACPVAAHLIGRWGGGIDAQGQGAIVRCQNSRPDGPSDVEGLRDLIRLGSREFWADQRLDGRAVTEGLRELRVAGD
jgi:hypothetical protein